MPSRQLHKGVQLLAARYLVGQRVFSIPYDDYQGSECVILAALKRHSSSLAASHEKVFVVSPHVGLAVSGLVSDGHEILTSLRRSAVDTNFVFNRDAKVSELVETMSKSLQVIAHLVYMLQIHVTQACTQHSSRRPYGAGVLLAGLDDNKAQLYQLLPTGEIHECQAVGIGMQTMNVFGILIH
jgi:20S proteasome subunit alpha 6